jgi:hypothetical protein
MKRRGWLDRAGELTPAGRAIRQDLEDRTDELAAQPLAVLAHQIEELFDVLKPSAETILSSDTIPFPNPMGLPRDFDR